MKTSIDDSLNEGITREIGIGHYIFTDLAKFIGALLNDVSVVIMQTFLVVMPYGLDRFKMLGRLIVKVNGGSQVISRPHFRLPATPE